MSDKLPEAKVKPREWTVEWRKDMRRWIFVAWPFGSDEENQALHAPLVHLMEIKEYYDLELKAQKLVEAMEFAMSYYKDCGDEAQPEYQLYKHFEAKLAEYKSEG